MDIKEIERLSKKLYKYLQNLGWLDLRELGINQQQAVKIKSGQPVRFYTKTLTRLRYLVEKKA